MNYLLTYSRGPLRNVRMIHNSIKLKNDIYYTKSHETLQFKNNEVKIGISDYARNELGDIVFIEAEIEIDEEIETGDTIATIESVKATSEVFTPSDGIVSDHNNELMENINNIENINEKDFWFVKYKPENIASLKLELMKKDDYLEFINSD